MHQFASNAEVAARNEERGRRAGRGLGDDPAGAVDSLVERALSDLAGVENPLIRITGGVGIRLRRGQGRAATEFRADVRPGRRDLASARRGRNTSGRTHRRRGVPQVLAHFPAEIVPFGDAVANFNPTFGQGMTMTSLQAGHLRRALQTGGDLETQLNRATAKTTFPVWTMNAIGDLVLHNAAGRMPRWYPWVGGLFDQFLGAAETDPVLAEWFLRRFSLLDSLYMIPPLRLVGRTVRHNMRRNAIVLPQRSAAASSKAV